MLLGRGSFFGTAWNKNIIYRQFALQHSFSLSIYIYLCIQVSSTVTTKYTLSVTKKNILTNNLEMQFSLRRFFSIRISIFWQFFTTKPIFTRLGIRASLVVFVQIIKSLKNILQNVYKNTFNHTIMHQHLYFVYFAVFSNISFVCTLTYL